MDMKKAERMEQEIYRIARIVATDIGIAPGMQVVDCFYLCERAGGAARHVILEPGLAGLFSEDRERGYDVFISLEIPIWSIPPVMIHELTHRLTVSLFSHRYDELNTGRLAGYDRQEFQEALAQRVELLFLYACYPL
jgi:hypothetical protein